MKRLLVHFDADLYLVDDEIPETLDEAHVVQAVQNELGVLGVVVNNADEWFLEGGGAA